MSISNTSISCDLIDQFESDFKKKTSYKIALNAVTNNGAAKVAINRQNLSDYQLTFSTDIKSPAITDQKNSGRCWIFAALNALRISAVDQMNLKDFEFSQSYLMFYDKLEKSNYFLENIIRTLDEDTNSRILMWLLEYCIEDGGQWSMFTSLIKKYGLVPKAIYTESISSSATNLMNIHISEKLREYTDTIRRNYQKNRSIDTLRNLKQQMLKEIHRILSIHNGIPPKKFHWSFRNKDGQFHTLEKDITPIEFKNHYVKADLDTYVSLINCPTQDKPFNKHYTVDFLGNVVGGDPVSYINVEIEVIKKAVIKTLKQGIPVWFGCDVGKAMSIDEGILDTGAFNFDELYDLPFSMTKSKAVEFSNAKMTHAMLITGVHEEANIVKRWKVENSWGKEKGRHKGFFVMGDAWFDRHVFQVVVPSNNVSIDTSVILSTTPKKLKPWDPMGSLASTMK